VAGVSGPSIWDAGHHPEPRGDANPHAASVGVRMIDGAFALTIIALVGLGCLIIAVWFDQSSDDE
jgi:hypothetical protein